MARKHLYEYYKKLREQYVEAKNSSEMMVKEFEAGHIDKERVDKFVELMRPVVDTFYIFEKAISLLNYDERKECKKKPITMEDLENGVLPDEDDKYSPAAIVKRNETCLEEMEEEVQGQVLEQQIIEENNKDEDNKDE